MSAPSSRTGNTFAWVVMAIAAALSLGIAGWAIRPAERRAANAAPRNQPQPAAQVADAGPIAAQKPLEFEPTFAASRDAVTPDGFTKHTPPDAMLDRLLKRLHTEALSHFYSDPRNGMSRMPVVFDRIVRTWTAPKFTTGELATITKLPFDDDLARIHAGSLKDFNAPKAKPPTKRTTRPVRVRNFRNFDRRKFEATKVWEARSVDLIGLIMHRDPVAYVSEKLPEMQKLGKVPTRELDDFEGEGLTALYNGRDRFARSKDGVVRLLGAVRARSDCLSCHSSHKTGDLLGAFSYTLREAKYVRKVPGLNKRLLQQLRNRKVLQK